MCAILVHRVGLSYVALCCDCVVFVSCRIRDVLLWFRWCVLFVVVDLLFFAVRMLCCLFSFLCCVVGFVVACFV